MNKTKILLLAITGMMATAFTACQSDDIDSTAGGDANANVYNVTADVDAAQDNQPGSRVLSVDATNKKVLHSTWAAGDKLIAFVSSDGTSNTRTSYWTIAADKSGKGSTFTGQIAAKGNATVKATDNLCFFYPADAVGKSIEPVTETGTDNGNSYHDEVNHISNLLGLNMTRQDGTAETIGKLYDYQYKQVQPKSIVGSNLNVSIGNMKRIVSLWGLRFTDNNNHILNNIDSVYISNVKGSDVFDLSAGSFVTNNPADESMNIVVTPPTGQKVSSAGGKYTYISLFPGTYKDVLIMVYVGNKCYKKEYASITFDEGKVYHTDLLSMPEVLPEPYVEVQGIKWATGNFIHYGPENGGYWGIAPAQWWISRRAVKLGSNRKPASNGTLQSSQFESSPTQTTDDVDLFRFGSIAKALSFNGLINGADTWGENEISQKISSDGKHGDIVWYYTKGNKRKYRMPTEAELRTLYTTANVIPAYCYTDKGTVVYGAFFTNNASNDANKRKKLFPTKAKKYDKYTNVTALVRANKGLFLPVTGRRLNGSDVIGYRDMAYGAGAYGQYMSSTSALMNWDFFFGPTEWNFAKAPKAQAKAIRPVLVEESATGSDNSFAPFANIK
jgi:putative lipoprotein